ncbi:MAG: mycofactocin system FadH/OYE family oxidoreductase 1 [Actinomycetes bacterium]
MVLTDPLGLGLATLPSRVVFGPHATNLGRRRGFSAAHATYYARRAEGGAGLIVTETASVHESDWPTECSPLAERSGEGWALIADACHRAGSVVIASLGHAGSQGSSSYSQGPLWAPSRVPEVNSHEVPLSIGDAEVNALIAGFRSAAQLAREAGLDGVEINAGQSSLLRQFASGLTNQRHDRYGEDRMLLTRQVIEAVREEIGDAIVGLRFCADELAPWAGITPETAVSLSTEFAETVDYLAVVRGSIYSAAATQPDLHEAPGFNIGITRSISEALKAVRGAAAPAVCLQGSIVDPTMAEQQVLEGVCDLVEMTRAQIADPDLVAKVRRGDASRVRPCLLCNQRCVVSDPRNPIVSCVVNPSAGHETADAHHDPDRSVAHVDAVPALVIGGGVAGMEAARSLARRGHDTRLVEASGRLGGTLLDAMEIPGRSRLGLLLGWLAAELDHEGVTVEMNRHIGVGDLEAFNGPVVAAIGAMDAPTTLRDGDDGSVVMLSAADVIAGRSSVADGEGAVVILDPIGGPIGVGVAEILAGDGPVALVTPDLIVGSQLAMSGDLVAANARLAGRGVEIVAHSEVVAVRNGAATIQDRYTGAMREIQTRGIVDAGHRLPRTTDLAEAEGLVFVGDAVAPRSIYEAILEGRRVSSDAVTQHHALEALR